ncbi:MAG TPA: chemotaxis protein CheA [Candidatus Acidoferrales bacterium]|nr:chemotaxis protein CheA [Candidatus Acidoferrales bacterium]
MSFPSDERSSELRDLFFESAEEILQNMNEAGLALETNPRSEKHLRAVRRAVHTLKGDSAACGFRELSDLAHELEDVLTPELAKQNPASIAEVVLAAADTFQEMLAALRNNLQPPAGGALRQHIQRLLKRPSSTDTAPASKGPAKAKFAWTEYERLMIAEALRGGEAVYNIAVHLDQDALPAVAFELVKKALQACGKTIALRPQSVSATESVRLLEAALSTKRTPAFVRKHCRIPSVVREVEIEKVTSTPAPSRDLLDILLQSEANAIAAGVKSPSSESVPAAEPHEPTLPAGLAHASENTLRVDAGRIDTVMNLVGELIIGKSMLQRAIAEFERSHAKDPVRTKFSDALAFQSRVLGELQKSVMKIRMVPVEQLFRRFPRIVRDVAKLRNKDIGLEIAGQNTDLDKSILDALSEPLAHIVRNAADHGIETAAERSAAGKPARGTICLNAYHEGDQVVIEVSDDGRGMDAKKILQKAIQQKLVSSDEAARLTESDIFQLVFAPGLTTAEEVTEISGRGVGLDVVKSSLDSLKGTVEIETETGKSTTFRLLVPLTLASIQTLLFRVKERLYAVPLASVVEITRISEDEIHSVENQQVFRLREQVLTLVRLDSLASQAPSDRAKRIFVVIIASGNRKFGLAVDMLAGEEELVIKPLDDNLVASPLVSGASILGDGTVVLILNVPAVLAHLSRIPPVGATA